MKLLIFVALAFSINTAQASFYQENCSSADRSVSMDMGHVQNGIQLTEFLAGKKSLISYNSGELKADLSQLSEIFSENNNACSDSNGGVSQWKTVKAGPVTFVKADGTLFPSNTMNVSSDLKSVKVYMMCELNGNSMMACPSSAQ